MKKGYLAEQVLPKIGNMGSDVVGMTYLATTRALDGDLSRIGDAFEHSRLEAFRRGEWKIDVDDFYKRLDGLRDKTRDSLVAAVRTEGGKKDDSFKSMAGAWMFDFAFDVIFDMASQSAHDYFSSAGGQVLIESERMNNSLRAELAAHKDGQWNVSHAELSACIVKLGVDMAVGSMSKVTRIEQTTVALGTVYALALPVALLVVFHYLRRILCKMAELVRRFFAWSLRLLKGARNPNPPGVAPPRLPASHLHGATIHQPVPLIPELPAVAPPPLPVETGQVGVDDCN